VKDLFGARGKKAGLPPGTPVHIGESRGGPVRITAFEYSEGGCRELNLAGPGECAALREGPGVAWINVDGVHDVPLVERIGELFGIHPLVLEDIVNTGQRPKVEAYDGFLFGIVKMLYKSDGRDAITAEQVSFVLTPRVLISFQEQEGDVFGPLRERLRQGKGVVRRRGADYLAYSLIDAIVDHYFLILEDLEDRIEPVEEAVVRDPQPAQLRLIQKLKSDMVFLRRSLWPLREMLSRLQHGDSPLVHQDTLPFLRDVHDHTIQVIEILESFQDLVSALIDIHMSGVSNRMNNIMKVLTVIATIFMPLTFVVGLYGMNFRYMPELGWKLGYPAVLLLMVCVAGGMMLFFKRKNWL
jgi:magnesium transporter